MSLPSFIYSQLLQKLPYPKTSYEGKTVIVTGSNVGLGKEASRHFARLGASSLILAVRDLDKGNAAKDDIIKTTGRPKSTVQVWKLDMGDYNSVIKFAERAAKDLERVDVLLANAGVATDKFAKAEENELQITINVVSTFLLGLAMMPKLKDTAKRFNTRPNLTITSSEVHGHTSFPEKSAAEGEIFNTLNDEAKANMGDRYPVSKLLEVFGVRAIAEKYPASSFPVTVNCVNPGLCHSELSRNSPFMLEVVKFFLARSTECGSRTLVNGASQGWESHGQYLHDCKVAQPAPLVLSEEGKNAQDRVWAELTKKLEAIKPGVTTAF